MRRIATFIMLGAAATFASAGQQTFTDTFTDGQNNGGWTWGFGDTIPSTGGNPGYYLRTQGLDTFAPRLRTTNPSPFTGDFRANGVTQMSVDIRIDHADSGAGGREVTLLLIHDNNTPSDFSDDTAAYFLGDDAPAIGAGWASYTYAVPAAQDPLPTGWQLINLGDSAAPPIHTWSQIVQDVDATAFMIGNPELFYIFQQWELGADNIAIVGDPPGPPTDVTGDGCVDNQDLGVLLAAYLSCSEDHSYNDIVDFVDDDCINNQDLGELLAQYLLGCS